MSHSYYKVWIHAVWGTKERFPMIKQESERKIHDLLKEQFKKMECPVRIINGMPDHVHCLFLLNPKKTIAEILQQVKGGSAHAINEQKITIDHFSWQTGYGVFSVSESQLDRVYN
ncbi:IS200/IS605 family transposase [Pedobacter sp. SD-b]|uniref:IS200/IS605 family transposase n=1 Tax=Pedobacter segetis TaxID=2793069 RepID=A0ABS1BNM7_9SPHI|nr:IS200/IS605 family transposase [Pedobacter segetis]MBK0384413.1 IS200/IS605 family transposase [Pedobacter segetis]